VFIELRNISKSYVSPSGTGTHLVLDHLSLGVKEGDSIAILGPSGSGKSTLLNIIGSLDQPSEGEVVFNNQKLSDLNQLQLSEFRNKELGFIFQLHHLLPQCTVLENVLIPTLAFPPENPKIDLNLRAKQLLERVGLAEHMEHRPGQLSGGEQQRVAVVRALINNPRLILADEPTGSLDQSAAENLGELLVELKNEDGVTLIVVTHSNKLAEHMKHVYNLTEGKLEQRNS
jgi:ABC-type lipoprotein export system ATPase subunit